MWCWPVHYNSAPPARSVWQFAIIPVLVKVVAIDHLLIWISGSMADVPKDLLQEIKRLEELFTVDKAKLKSITAHFISELDKGKLLLLLLRQLLLIFRQVLALKVVAL